ncbi:MAG: CHAD domain-containing protein, partial [Candidatus Tectomicrobia bacterium]|nr:CHAD domain-containing protein [Candidatus Tectomicrobia bacterium]
MEFQFRNHESVPEGIKRIVREHIDGALDQLPGQTDADRDEAIHNVRKLFKEIRAVLRMVRDEIGGDVYEKENICFRDAGRRL